MDPQQNPEQNNTNQSNQSGQSSQPTMSSDNSTLMGILAYLGILIIIPLIVARENPFVKFHIKQALLLLIGDVVVWLLGSYVWQFWPLVNILSLIIFIYVIIGIINVVHHQEKELPFIGHLAASFKI